MLGERIVGFYSDTVSVLARAPRSGNFLAGPSLSRLRLAGVAGMALAAGILFTGSGQAQELREVVELAVQSHPAVSTKKAGYRAAEQTVEEIDGEFLPSLDLTADSGYQHAHRATSSSVEDDLWRNRQRLSLTQSIFDGGDTSNRSRSSVAEAKAKEYDVHAEAIKIAQRTIHAYLNVARDRELLEFSIENVKLHQGIFGDVEEAARAGGGSGARVAQVRTRLYNAQSQRRKAEGNLRNSVIDFQEAVGQEPGDLQERPFPDFVMPESAEAALDEALRNNPEFLSSMETERAANLSIKAERSAFLPSVDLELAHERRDGVDGERELETDSTALLKLTWNFYKGGSDRAAVRRATERSSEAKYKIHQVDRLIRQDLETAYNDYQVARDQVQLLRDRVSTAGEVTNAYTEQFRLGQRTLVELLDSGNELFLAKVDQTTTEYEQIRAAYDFLAVSGTLLQTLGIQVAAGETSNMP